MVVCCHCLAKKRLDSVAWLDSCNAHGKEPEVP